MNEDKKKVNISPKPGEVSTKASNKTWVKSKHTTYIYIELSLKCKLKSSQH